ncbi:MAG: amino acid dehydrogenase [Henriciella sp.]|jgi:leucine dehydrogenase|uniref:Glu/Leu/Phe/Val family dehydrogenase n=1 Tax=Henriciella sp. TaxID=1968823 RepID=UPI000C0E9464|nr:Glu/Leu/Phe/Val dehydrogenase [Henriciella sp.]MAN75539.1 amino acid dehydrogenase [Henriciella sp.]PHR72473.1 MAG: amino acid dehydrogenase [Henriciella sp.]|tara:strand:- start:415 stop:1461 length:1047 start_codon:yes stop_codon:yes gene_type:complete
MFDHPSFDGHEGVHMFEDAASGLKAIIAVHSTALGPAAGGCRMWNYDTGEEALRDALRLSKGMSFKNAMAGLPLGGGKAVIWGNSKTGKSKELFEAFGRAINSLNGSYYTAEDVGISPQDMQIVATQTEYVAGLDQGDAASGDPSPITALGVYRGIKASAKRAFGSDSLEGRTIAVQGVGHVGGYLCDHLAEEGAHLIITDIDQDLLKAVSERTGAKIVASDEIYDQDVDIFSPNALGAVINPETLPRLKAKVVAGGANNQLAIAEMDAALRDRGILYAPDYVINGGGIINVAAEISGAYSRNWVMGKLNILIETLGEVLDEAKDRNAPTNEVAEKIARARIAEAQSS